jgi:hypothetical protein
MRVLRGLRRRVWRDSITAALVVVAGALAGPALAASDDAWEAFRADVEAKCLAAAEPLFQTATATVDPFGSASYGLALVTGPAKGATETTISAICVFDKQAKTVEIGGELPPVE